jgi:cytochrome c551
MRIPLVSIGAILVVVVLSARIQVLAQTAPKLTPAGEGRRVYLRYNCYGCHGMRAGGGMGPNIVRAESGDLREAVMEGEDGGMPSFRALLTSTDISNLSAYLSSIGTPNEPRFDDWWVPVPTK